MTRNPLRALREDRYGASQVVMCQALGVSQNLLGGTETGLYTKVPRAILKGLVTLGHDPEQMGAAYEQWHKELQAARIAQLQQARV